MRADGGVVAIGSARVAGGQPRGPAGSSRILSRSGAACWRRSPQGRLGRRRARTRGPGVALSTQRESVLIWQRSTGRAAGTRPRLAGPSDGRLVHGPAGRRLPAAAAVCRPGPASGSTHVLGAEAALAARPPAAGGPADDICAGTVDAWLVWRLTGGRVHATDAGNASRTLLYDVTRAGLVGGAVRAVRRAGVGAARGAPSNAGFGRDAPASPASRTARRCRGAGRLPRRAVRPGRRDPRPGEGDLWHRHVGDDPRGRLSARSPPRVPLTLALADRHPDVRPRGQHPLLRCGAGLDRRPARAGLGRGPGRPGGDRAGCRRGPAAAGVHRAGRAALGPFGPGRTDRDEPGDDTGPRRARGSRRGRPPDLRHRRGDRRRRHGGGGASRGRRRHPVRPADADPGGPARDHGRGRGRAGGVRDGGREAGLAGARGGCSLAAGGRRPGRTRRRSRRISGTNAVGNGE